MSDLIRKQDILRTWQNVCIGIICSECQFYNDDAMNGDCLLERWVHSLPSAESETKLIAEVKMSKEDIQSAVDEAVERIMAQPERKNGKWIGKEQFANSPEFYSWQCSVCGCVLEDPTLDKPYPFCPNCGSFNGGEQE